MLFYLFRIHPYYEYTQDSYYNKIFVILFRLILPIGDYVLKYIMKLINENNNLCIKFKRTTLTVLSNNIISFFFFNYKIYFNYLAIYYLIQNILHLFNKIFHNFFQIFLGA